MKQAHVASESKTFVRWSLMGGVLRLCHGSQVITSLNGLKDYLEHNGRTGFCSASSNKVALLFGHQNLN